MAHPQDRNPTLPQTQAATPTEAPHATHPALAAVALIDATAAAATGSMSLSWWHEKVAAGEAPQPVIRAPRCTRWRAVDVAEFWQRFGERARAGAADRLLTQAKRASATAATKRRALAGGA